MTYGWSLQGSAIHIFIAWVRKRFLQTSCSSYSATKPSTVSALLTIVLVNLLVTSDPTAKNIGSSAVFCFLHKHLLFQIYATFVLVKFTVVLSLIVLFQTSKGHGLKYINPWAQFLFLLLLWLPWLSARSVFFRNGNSTFADVSFICIQGLFWFCLVLDRQYICLSYFLKYVF